MEIDEAFEVLGVRPGTPMVQAWDPYQRLRRAELDAGAAPGDPVVRRLDDAFIAIRDGERLTRSVGQHNDDLAIVIGGRSPTRVEPQAEGTVGHPPSRAVTIVRLPDRRAATMRSASDVRGRLEAGGIEIAPVTLDTATGADVPAYALIGASDDELQEWLTSVPSDILILWRADRLEIRDTATGAHRTTGWRARASEAQPSDVVQQWATKSRERREARERRQVERDAERARYLEDGWPAAWTLDDIRRLAQTGVSGGTVNALLARGWERSEVLASSDVLGPTSVAPLGDAAEYRAHGETLRDLLGELWPVAPDGTLWSKKVLTRDGSRMRSCVVARDEEFSLHDWDDATLEWVARPSCSTFLDALADLPGALHLAREAATWLTCDAKFEEPVRVRLSTDAAPDEDPDLWPPSVAAEWIESSADVEEVLTGVRFVDRWGALNGSRIVALPLEGMEPLRLQPVVVDLRAEEVRALRTLARYSWYSDGGGAPISWDGGNELSLLAPSLLLVSQWGDYGPSVTVEHVGEEVADLVRAVSDWVVSVDAEVPAALALEPFDIDTTLPDSEREALLDLLGKLTVDITFDLQPDEATDVRAALAQRSVPYRLARDALARPADPAGQRFALVVEEVVESGVIGELLSFGKR